MMDRIRSFEAEPNDDRLAAERAKEAYEQQTTSLRSDG